MYLIVSSEYMLEVSKYRVKLDEVKKELVVNEKRLEETQVDFNETNAKLAQIESVGRVNKA